MKLLNDLYKIVQTETTETGFRCQVSMNAAHTIYKAHFPDNPVTPGVCLVQMGTELLHELKGLNLSLTEIAKIKYRNVVKPADMPWFSFENLTTDDEGCRVRVSIDSADSNFALMTLKLSPNE